MDLLRSRDVRTAVAHSGTDSAQQECSSAFSELASHSGADSDGQCSAACRAERALDVTLRRVRPCGRSWLRHSIDRDRVECCIGLASRCADTVSSSSNLDGTLFCSVVFGRHTSLYWRIIDAGKRRLALDLPTLSMDQLAAATRGL